MSCISAYRFVIAILVGLTSGASVLSPALGQPQSKPSAEQPEPVPPLSVETLYHPDKKYAYVPSAAPAMRWTSDDAGQPLLLIKRPEGWMQLAPAALGTATQPLETPWPGAQKLKDQLLSLGDIDAEKAESAVSAWIAAPSRSLDRALVRIDQSLAVAGLKQTPQWVTRQGRSWRDATLSPDGTRVAFVQENDLYVLHLPSERLVRITDDGSETRLNGRLDWVYQEELYGRGNFKAFWWSDDSRAIALLRLDNSHVLPYTITVSDTPQGSTLVERYPKAGDPITAAELWVARLGEDASSDIALTPVFAPPPQEELLIVRVGWRAGSRELVYAVTNRLQNELTLWRCDLEAAAESQPVAILHERCDQWLEVVGLPHWLPEGDFLWLSDLPEGRRRLWRVRRDGSSRVPLTPADFDVRELVAVNPQTGAAYVTGDQERGTVGQQLYRVDLGRDSEASAALTPLTSDQPWHRVTLSSDQTWMLDHAGSLTQPTVVSLRRCDGAPTELTAVHVLHREELRLPAPAIEPLWPQVKTPDGLMLPAYLFPPRAIGNRQPEGDTDPSQGDNKRFPVLIEVYGGPLAPTVRDTWSSSRYLFHQMLADQGIGVLVVDNRSSGGRGLADAWSIYRRVGEQETQDLLAAVDWLKTLPWVDHQRIAVRGWSFGGFQTLHAMTHSDAFAAGVAGGSVTDWRNYDAIYTERYMGLPADNAAGYDATSTVRGAERLSGRVLMIHGELDDNVHLANTLQMTAALQRAGKSFDLMIYPAAAHSVHGAMPVYHLMRTTVEFLQRELNGDP